MRPPASTVAHVFGVCVAQSECQGGRSLDRGCPAAPSNQSRMADAIDIQFDEPEGFSAEAPAPPALEVPTQPTQAPLAASSAAASSAAPSSVNEESETKSSGTSVQSMCIACNKNPQVNKHFFCTFCKKDDAALWNQIHRDYIESGGDNAPQEKKDHYKEWKQHRASKNPTWIAAVIEYGAKNPARGRGAPRGNFDTVRFLERIKKSTAMETGWEANFFTHRAWLDHAVHIKKMSPHAAQEEWQRRSAEAKGLERKLVGGEEQLAMHVKDHTFDNTSTIASRKRMC